MIRNICNNVLKKEFTEELENFLVNELLIKNTLNIPDILFYSMSTDLVHYHTPAHILNMFDFAISNQLLLQPGQKLAVWFHDAVYIPNRSDNEEKSESLMMLLLDHLIPKNIINISSDIILDTKKHFTKTPLYSKYSELVMDLDLCSFCDSFDYVLMHNEQIDKEFSINYKDSLDYYYSLRIKFLQTILNCKQIFRTDYFIDKFEKHARENISTLIGIYNDRC